MQRRPANSGIFPPSTKKKKRLKSVIRTNNCAKLHRKSIFQVFLQKKLEILPQKLFFFVKGHYAGRILRKMWKEMVREILFAS